MGRRLVITADDLGRDPATTSAVLDLLANGHATSTTLLVVTPGSVGAAAAVAALGLTPRLHLALTSERDLPPWPPLTTSMLDAGAHLPTEPRLLDTLAGEAVAVELEAQLAWMHEHGLRPGGADSHAGTLYGLTGPSRLELTLRWCAEHGLGFRLPRELDLYLEAPLPEDLSSKHLDAVALADELGVPVPQAILTNRRTASELGTYEVLRDRMIAVLDRLPDGVSELFLHPAEGLPGETGVLRAWEARLLRDPVWHAALDSADLALAPDWWTEQR